MAKPPTIEEWVLRQLVMLKRLENEAGALAEGRIATLFDQIARILMGVDLDAGNTARVIDEASKAIAPVFDAIHRDLSRALPDLGTEYARWLAGTMQRVLAGAEVVRDVTLPVTPQLLRAVVTEQPVEGALLKDWFRAQGERTAFRVGQQIRLGVLNGEGPDQIARRIRGKSLGRGRYSGGVMATTAREASAIARTATNQIANRAALDTYEANQDLTNAYRISATLDHRTSDICKVLDGKVFKYSDPARRMPPFHMACRTTVIPEIDWKGLGVDPPDGDTPPDYEEWLRGQSAEKQREILGPTAQAAFAKGLPLRDIIKADGTRVSADKLREMTGAPAKGKAAASAPKFQPLGTTKEVQAWLKAEGYATDVTLSGMDVGVANEVARALHDAKHNYNLRPLDKLASSRAGGYAGLHEYAYRGFDPSTGKRLDERETLRFSTRAIPSVDEFAEKRKKINGQPKYADATGDKPRRWSMSESVYDVATHEIGHALHFQKANDFFLHRRNTPAYKLQAQRYKVDTWHRDPEHKKFRVHIGEYSNTNTAEYVADSFVAWTRGSPPIHPDMRRFIEEVLIR